MDEEEFAHLNYQQNHREINESQDDKNGNKEVITIIESEKENNIYHNKIITNSFEKTYVKEKSDDLNDEMDAYDELLLEADFFKEDGDNDATSEQIDMEIALSFINRIPKVILERKEFFKCNKCSNVYLTNRELNIHLVKHISRNVSQKRKQKLAATKVPPADPRFKQKFKCEYCDWRFVCSSTLTTHLKVHDPYPHMCSCGIGYYRLTDLEAHKLIMHRVKVETVDRRRRNRGPWLAKIKLKSNKPPQQKRRSKLPQNLEYLQKPKKLESYKEIDTDHDISDDEIDKETRCLNDFLEVQLQEDSESDEEYFSNQKMRPKPKLRANLLFTKPKVKVKKEKVARTPRLPVAPKTFVCDICNKVLKDERSLMGHMRVHSGEKPFQCDICLGYYSQSGALKIHKERVHFKQKNVECPFCGKLFHSVGEMQRHENIHMGVKPYECTFCKKRFTDPSAHKRHVRTHTGDKRYKCERCPMAFTDASGLIAHRRTHTDERKHTCKDCGKKYRVAYQLRKHRSIVHDNNAEEVECDICGFKTAHKGNLAGHIERAHVDKPAKCKICKKVVKNAAVLRLHMYNTHKRVRNK